MIRARWFRRLGWILLAAVFLLAGWRLARRALRENHTGQITLRFAHWQLEGTTRQAFDVLIHDYEELHPNVRIEQLAIPLPVYSSWGTTHVIGGAAPDLVELGRWALWYLFRSFRVIYGQGRMKTALKLGVLGFAHAFALLAVAIMLATGIVAWMAAE